MRPSKQSYLLLFSSVLLLLLLPECRPASTNGHDDDYYMEAIIDRIPPKFLTFGEFAMSRGIALFLLKALEVSHIPFQNLDERKDPMMVTFPVDLPPFPDPINLLPLELTLPDIDLQPELFLNGFVAACEPSLEGLSQMDEEHLVLGYSLVTKEAIADLSYRFPAFGANSRYLTNIYFNYSDAVGSGEFTFSSPPPDGGLAVFGFNNLSLLLKAKGMLPIQVGRDRMSLDELDFDFDYSDFVLLVSSLHLDGEEVGDLDLGGLLGPLIKLIWGQLRIGIVESVRCQLDHAINDCVLLDLIGGAFGCLKLELHPPCFPETPNATDVSVLSLLEALEEVKLNQGTLGFCVPDQETSPQPTTTTEEETDEPTTTAATTTSEIVPTTTTTPTTVSSSSPPSDSTPASTSITSPITSDPPASTTTTTAFTTTTPTAPSASPPLPSDSPSTSTSTPSVPISTTPEEATTTSTTPSEENTTITTTTTSSPLPSDSTSTTPSNEPPSSTTPSEEDTTTTTTTTTTPAPTTEPSTEPPTTAGAPKGVGIWLLPIFLISALWGLRSI